MNLAVEDAYLRRHPAEAADVLDALPADALPATVAAVDPGALAEAMEYLSPTRAVTVFTALPAAARIQLLERAAPRLAMLVLGDLPAVERDDLLAAVRPGTRDDLTRLLAFPDNTAGRLMERSFVGARAGMTVAQALARLQQSGIRRARSLFVIDADNRLAGRVDLQDLALAHGDEPLRDHMQPVEGFVTAMDPREEVVALLERTRLDAVPVVDLEGRLLGVVRYRSLLRALEDVATADLQKMVGVSADERALSGPCLRCGGACRGCTSTCSRRFWPPRWWACSKASSPSSPRWPCCCRWWRASPATPARRRWR
jgi:magnesium transporter